MRHVFLALALTVSLSAAPAFAKDSPSQASASDPEQAIKCRKIEVTGSLVKRGKVCKTVAEWKRIQENGNHVARATWEGGLVCSGGECRGN